MANMFYRSKITILFLFVIVIIILYIIGLTKPLNDYHHGNEVMINESDHGPGNITYGR